MTYGFDLVAQRGLEVSQRDFERMQFWLLEFQPATQVSLVGDPPSRIRVSALGAPAEIAPALLARIEELAGAPLQFELLEE